MWTPKYENGCLIMLKYALEPLYAPEPLCDCLHQVVAICRLTDKVCFQLPTSNLGGGSERSSEV